MWGQGTKNKYINTLVGGGGEVAMFSTDVLYNVCATTTARDLIIAGPNTFEH